MHFLACFLSWFTKKDGSDIAFPNRPPPSSGPAVMRIRQSFCRHKRKGSRKWYAVFSDSVRACAARRHEIVPPARKRLTAKQPPHGIASSSDQTPFSDCPDCIQRAGRIKPAAGFPFQRGQKPTVETNERNDSSPHLHNLSFHRRTPYGVFRGFGAFPGSFGGNGIPASIPSFLNAYFRSA